ncbi:MAG: hypothetical protein K9J12_06125 [Melioribacteraceae bacterium]|nr:hypothetical protein [Melioribacteraceae bacterium]MCF8264665.1 hypothetical protein [Melioribacteraceae bacterium]MCF8432098.1 hypothetical protein [Melioribacteraceae bacterium]
MTKTEFITAINQLDKAVSTTGKVYRSITADEKNISFLRPNKTEHETIDLRELLDLFVSEKSPNTTIAKKYITGRVQSPAIAIINSIKSSSLSLIANSSGMKIKSKKSTQNIKKEVKSKTNAETKFFTEFAKLIGNKYLLSESVGKPIKSDHTFLNSNFREYDFDQKVLYSIEKLLDALNSDKNFNSKSLSHYVDGMTIYHPILKTRIVEFDEEQHFTPARNETLIATSAFLESNLYKLYKKICGDLDYINEDVLKKHRIRSELVKVPKTFKAFVQWLDDNSVKSSGYIKEKSGFEFLGGRIAQRAYYDSLRDLAHLSPKNQGFESIIRFPKKYFEDKANCNFLNIKNDEIRVMIHLYLKDIYDLKL